MAVLVGVYPDERIAEDVTRALRRAAPEGAAIAIADPFDAQESTAAEMDAELSQGWGGVAAFLTKEQMRGAIAFAVGLSVAGAILGLPLGLLYSAPASLLVKLGIGALVGSLFGSVVGTLLGGGFAMRSPADDLAAERGVTVSCEPDTETAEIVMGRFHPLRLDRMDRGQLLATPATEGPSGLAESIDQFRRNTASPPRQG